MLDMNIISTMEAVEMVKSNDEIVTGLGCSEGRLFMESLHLIADQVENVSITNCLPMHKFEFMDEKYKETFFINGWFYSPAVRTLHRNGNASFIPNNLHFAATKRLDHKKPSIYIGACSAVDQHGYVSLSMGNTYERRMMEAADIVILETNKNFPRTFGDVEIHVSEVDYFIEAEYEVPELPHVEPNEKDKTIGQHIADHIKDGDNLQFGIGGIPNAVAAALYDKKDLGIHTEMLTSEIAKLAKAGVINGSKKSLHKGKIVTTFIMGNQLLYDFVNDNPSVMVLDGNYVNHPTIIAKNDNQISINTTLEIDLTGQCASESIGPIQYSGTGGQADTARGAQDAKNGKSFIALYSTAMIKNKKTGEREKRSKIVPFLTPGAVVSLQRNDVDYVVTEYGVAKLRGTNVNERVERLIAIAHPDFREDLWKQAKELSIVGGA
ncbi:acetyl-CoA hydrolase/transferase family protein [Alkalibacterium kapii]|uniref:4-hydroxybutyrate CoA-transferase n=1 Tax=Alkalibacterium kapii TaxID=426704 RepID=A0A511B0R7_9LACT|nr:acetyl-CoA hydrolase/transferase C-terminal domain-containing protein [Alkalibacterium kapii]GEK91397.1 4-hydroxybutyrate CoA-transferase [Alkalibacterium kapii]